MKRINAFLVLALIISQSSFSLAAFSGAIQIKGVLSSYTKDTVTIKTEKGPLTFPRTTVDSLEGLIPGKAEVTCTMDQKELFAALSKSPYLKNTK